MKKYYPLILFMVLCAGWTTVLNYRDYFDQLPLKLAHVTNAQLASIAAAVNSPFHYAFSVNGTLSEAGSMDESSSSYWWLNSGGYFYLTNGIGETIQGDLPALNKWRVAYSISNPEDTDNGYHPQNIFRLVSRSKWQNFQQEAYLQIERDQLSSSPNRNASNGLLLFNRYQDSATLYYTGIRVDGYAVIKKKINGVYYTMAYNPIVTGVAPYNRDANPNLLPKNIWIGLRSQVKTNSDGTVSVKLYMDRGKTGNWTLVAQATDNGKSYGGAPILNAGFGGIRTDFMDVQMDDYQMTSL